MNPNTEQCLESARGWLNKLIELSEKEPEARNIVEAVGGFVLNSLGAALHQSDENAKRISLSLDNLKHAVSHDSRGLLD